MKYVFDDLSEIQKNIEKSGGAILLLDFDGVLSAIAQTDEKAFISNENFLSGKFSPSVVFVPKGGIENKIEFNNFFTNIYKPKTNFNFIPV